MPGLGTSLGRGGATTAPNDLLNSDAILIMGSNMAENHPVGFQWVIEAKEKGAKVIHVDPRFSRTSAVANIWVPLRAGSDIIFLGALIRYALENEVFFREYVVHYTNAGAIIPKEFADTRRPRRPVFRLGRGEEILRSEKLAVRRRRKPKPAIKHTKWERLLTATRRAGMPSKAATSAPDLSRFHQDPYAAASALRLPAAAQTFCSLHAANG